MMNEEKVILMTRLASYESNEGKKDISIVNYFKGDYIGFQILKSVIAATIAFFALFGVYIFYNFEISFVSIVDFALILSKNKFCKLLA